MVVPVRSSTTWSAGAARSCRRGPGSPSMFGVLAASSRPPGSTTTSSPRWMPAPEMPGFDASPAGGLTTIDVQRLARDECGAFEIEDGIDDVADLADAAQRVKGIEALVRLGVVGGGPDDAERDGIHAHALRRIFDRQRTAGRHESTLGQGGKCGR